MRKILFALAGLLAAVSVASAAASFNYTYPVDTEQFLEAWFAQYRAGVGYTQGLGASVTQASSRTTAVTINAPTGAITMFTAAGSATAATFTVNDSSVEVNDVIALSTQTSTTNLYELFVTKVAAGSFNITFFTTSGTTSDTPIINFAVIKASPN